MVYDNIPHLIGYNKCDVLSIDDNCVEKWFNNGIKINIKVNGEHHNYIHYISEKKLAHLISINRESSLSNVLDNGNDVSVDCGIEWRVGDMCYLDFNIHFISEMWDDKIVSCSNSFGGTTSLDLRDRCFKITPHTMRCSDDVLFYSRWIDQIEYLVPRVYKLNYSNINDTFVEIWVDLINGVIGSELRLRKFGNDIINAIKERNYGSMYMSDIEENDYKIFIPISTPLDSNIIN